MRQLLVFGLCVMSCTLWLGLSAVKIVNVVRPGPGLQPPKVPGPASASSRPDIQLVSVSVL